MFKGSGSTTGAYTFRANQSLIGAGATLSVGALTITGSAANTPTLSGTLMASSVTGPTVDGLSMSTDSSNAINFTSAAGTFTFTSISANGCSTGIPVDTLSAGSFTVNGTGSIAGSGGAIQELLGQGGGLQSGEQHHVEEHELHEQRDSEPDSGHDLR